jgi:hypothetical protein
MGRASTNCRSSAYHQVRNCLEDALTARASPSSVAPPVRERSTMSELRRAFEALRGNTYTFDELRTEVRRIRVDGFGTLPADMDARNLVELGLRQRWIVERKDGKFAVR